jgi:hypothetical protein
MERELKVRPVISVPSGFMGEEPTKTGYWGFVRSKGDYEREKESVLSELKELIEKLSGEGFRISLLPELELPPNLMAAVGVYEQIRESDVILYLTFAPPGDLCYSFPGASRYLIFLEKFRPNVYSGTLFSPPRYQEMKRRGLGNRVFIVEGDFEKLKKILRVLCGLKMIFTSRLICVGPMNSGFGGWISLTLAEEKFGCKMWRFYSYDQFTQDFESVWEKRRDEVKAIADRFASGATKIVEVGEENLLRAAAYHLVLKGYLEENGSDWVTVNCLSQLIGRVKATPCMSFALLNDEGKVGTCEADPTAGPMHYLMRHISGRPAFFNDPTVNEKEGTLILAHCTSPTKFIGFDKPGFKYQVRTHHESNTSATVKPIYEKGTVTVAGLSFDYDEMLIVKGEVVGTPDLRICRSQVEVKVSSPTQVLEDWRGFHWIMVYGDYMEELTFICKATGIKPILHT